MIELNSTLISQIIDKRPRRLRVDSNNDPNLQKYLDFWESHAHAVEGFLGEGYKVIGFDPDFLVKVTLYPDNPEFKRAYTMHIPLEVAVLIKYKLLW